MVTKKRLTLSQVKKVRESSESFGESLKSERKCREMSRKEFSSILEISIQSLADLEHGRSLPSPTRAKKIAEFLGEPEIYWIQLALQDQLEKQEIPFKVTLAV